MADDLTANIPEDDAEVRRELRRTWRQLLSAVRPPALRPMETCPQCGGPTLIAYSPCSIQCITASRVRVGG